MIFTLTSETGPLLTKSKIYVPEGAYVLPSKDKNFRLGKNVYNGS